MKLPEFAVKHDGYSRLFVSWSNETHNFHFWIDPTGQKLDEILHSNPKIEPKSGRWGHRALDQNSKKWAPVIKGIMDKIQKEQLIGKAIQERRKQEAKEEEDRQEKHMQDCKKRLFRAAATLPPGLQLALTSLPDNEQVLFVDLIDAFPMQ